MWVPGLAWSEDNGYVVYRLLKRELMSVCFSFDDEHCTYNLVCCDYIYNSIGSLVFGTVRIGLQAKRAFISSSPAVAASVHSKCSVHRRRRQRGSAFSPNREMKRLKAATHPVNFWICLRSVGMANCDRARILAGFATIPLLETMKPRSFPAGTPKTHFSGLSLMSYVLSLSNVSLKSSIRDTTRENPSSSAGFRPISSAGLCATDKALQLTNSSSVPPPTLRLNWLSSSEFEEECCW